MGEGSLRKTLRSPANSRRSPTVGGQPAAEQTEGVTGVVRAEQVPRVARGRSRPGLQVHASAVRGDARRPGGLARGHRGGAAGDGGVHPVRGQARRRRPQRSRQGGARRGGSNTIRHGPASARRFTHRASPEARPSHGYQRSRSHAFRGATYRRRKPSKAHSGVCAARGRKDMPPREEPLRNDVAWCRGEPLKTPLGKDRRRRFSK